MLKRQVSLLKELLLIVFSLSRLTHARRAPPNLKACLHHMHVQNKKEQALSFRTCSLQKGSLVEVWSDLEIENKDNPQIL